MKILVVDDEQDLCEILRFNLESEGFEVDTACSAEEALGKLGARSEELEVADKLITHHSSLITHYDLYLLDVMMDRMSGFEMAERLRSQGDDTPIIFLTARDAHDDQLQGFGLGADDYITKPFSFDTVLARIKAVLRRSTANTPNIQNTPTTLTKRELLILNLFSDNPGRYFTREEILAAVWPDDTCVGERSVDVHIARLRKKLGAEGTRIVNKTGLGYGLV